MTKYSKKQKPSQQTQDEAMAIAKGTQRSGQTKDQTRFIAQGIQKGIDLYKKQQKSKARELDKKLKNAANEQEHSQDNEDQTHQSVKYKQHWLPWILLAMTLLLIAVYLLTGNPLV